MGNKYAVFIPNEHGDVRSIYDSALDGPADQRRAAAETLLSTALSLTTVPGLHRYKATGPMFRAAFNLTKCPEALNLEAREYYEVALGALDVLEDMASGSAETYPHGPAYYVAEVKGFAKEAQAIANKMMGASSPATLTAEVESGKYLSIVLPGAGDPVAVVPVPKTAIAEGGTWATQTGALYQQAAAELIEKAEQVAATAAAIDLTTPEAASASADAIAATKAGAKLTSPKLGGVAGAGGKLVVGAVVAGLLYLWLRG